jgi:SAM-dependent methyltransferase
VDGSVYADDTGEGKSPLRADGGSDADGLAGGFDDLYAGTPPWDVEGPQPTVERLASTGAIEGPVVDVGCGTGENALYLAAEGYRVVGVDGSPRAIERARRKRFERGLDGPTEFVVGDALSLPDVSALGPHRPFGTALDSAVYHQFPRDEVSRYLRAVRSVLRPGGRFHVLAFSEREPDGWGPRRVPRAELASAFDGDGWALEGLDRVRFAMRRSFLAEIGRGDADGVHAWLASARRVD